MAVKHVVLVRGKKIITSAGIQKAQENAIHPPSSESIFRMSRGAMN
jgi:hypothetical protein